ncbi:MAG TPA: methyl-accepting chemotaxis protein [Cycloclasticus sp.]|jgi:methyl-accepting chemotaxis protein|nr:methyl-accepting chemotaxis protein [Cycloclasticus sp.]HIL91549.1 methyl-accepting chemotaxis protein [Cycloclasticus sp.]
MTIKSKLTIAVSVAIGLLAINESTDAVETQVRQQLIATRENKKAAIESYFTRVNNQVLTFANDRMMINGAINFKESLAESSGGFDVDDKRAALKQYYQQDFANEYNKRNVSATKDTAGFVDSLDDYAVDMQFHYIANNKHPLGEKDTLDMAADYSQYSTYHKMYHPHIRDYAKKFGFYDIFIVDPDSGQVVYSVYKEIDYATYLNDGDLANSGLGRAFKRANALESAGTVIEDFKPYYPSYNDQASFIAAPIFDNGNKVGVLVIQIPLDKVNAIMTNNNQWKASGMGDTGESYIVGDDLNMRSISGFLVEDKQAYLEELKSEGVAQNIVEVIAVKNSSIGLQAITSDAAKAAIAGKTGEATVADHRHVNVLSAYTPLDIKGLNWALVTTMDEEEAFHPAVVLRNEIIKIALIVIVVMGGIATLLGFYLSKVISAPIESFSMEIKEIIKDNRVDLTKRIPSDGDDEFSLLANDINTMLAKNQHVIVDILSSTVELQNTTSNLIKAASQTKSDLDKQQQYTVGIADSMQTMSTMVNEIVTNVSNTAEQANERNELALEGNLVITKTIEAINYLSSNIGNTADVVDQLEVQSNSIGSVLDVIKGVAEQTNLLALNAAIEAARAGEQGRGFAVVADEVRTLASRTQGATAEIQNMIQELQLKAKESANVMKETNNQANEASEMASQGHTALDSMSSMMDHVKGMTTDIVNSTNEQAAATVRINESIAKISGYAEQTQHANSQSIAHCKDLELVSRKMESIVKVFVV